MINKRQRDELLLSFFPKEKEILVNAYNLQKELQQKDEIERALIDLTTRFMALKDKLEQTRYEVFELKATAPYYERFEVVA